MTGPLLNTGFHFNVDSWPGHVGNVFNQQMQQNPNDKQLNNRTKANPTCSFVLTSSSLEGSGDSEVSFIFFKKKPTNRSYNDSDS